MDLLVVIKYFIVENELSESHNIGNTQSIYLTIFTYEWQFYIFIS